MKNPNDTLNCHEMKMVLEGIYRDSLSSPVTGQVVEHIAYHQRRRIYIPKGVFQQNTTRQVYYAHLVDLYCTQSPRCPKTVNGLAELHLVPGLLKVNKYEMYT